MGEPDCQINGPKIAQKRGKMPPFGHTDVIRHNGVFLSRATILDRYDPRQLPRRHHQNW